LPENIRNWALSGIGISLIAGIIFSILAPYQTGQFSFLFRLIYWTGLCFVGGLGASVFEPLARKIGIDPSGIVLVLGQSLTASMAVTACLAGLDIYLGGLVQPQNLFLLFCLVWVISITIASIAYMADKASSPVSAQLEQRPPIFDRLKPALRHSEIYALMAEDHYVRVITSKGEELVLMRLSDAIKELGNVKGIAVHRSWWVAEAGVKSSKKSDGKISLELHTGQIAPVSRSNTKSVRAARWIS